MLNIFVSHTWDDKVKPQFGQIRQELDAYDLWIDKKGLGPGDNIRKKIAEAISASEVFILLWSEKASASDDVMYEIETAAKFNKRIFPCLIDDNPLPEQFGLKEMLYIDLREPEPGISPLLGWMRLKYYLSNIYIDKIESKLDTYSPEAKQKILEILPGLKSKQQSVKRTIDDMMDTLHRIKQNAGDRDAKNPYTINMLNTLSDTLNQPDSKPEEKQLAEAMNYAKELFNKYPRQDSTSKKIREGLLLQKFLELDPDETNPHLNEMKRLFLLEETLGSKEIRTENNAAFQPDLERDKIIAQYDAEIRTKLPASRTLVKDAMGGILPDIIFDPIYERISYYFTRSSEHLQLLKQVSSQPSSHPMVKESLIEICNYINNPGGFIHNDQYGILGYTDDAYLITWCIELLARKGFVDYSNWNTDWDTINTCADALFGLFDPSVRQSLDSAIENLFNALDQKFSNHSASQVSDLDRQRAELQKSRDEVFQGKLMQLWNML